MLEVNPEPCRVPVGAMFIWLTDTAPAGWLLCYGQAISRAIYAKLFGIIGITFGIGDGSTTFNLPDMRGRLPLGQDDMGGASADRVTNAEADSIGGSSGAENHTLSLAESPAHTHTNEHTHDVEHTHELPTSDPYEAGTDSFQLDALEKGSPLISTKSSSNPTSGASSDSTTTSKGGDESHNNMQPYLTANYIMKH